jgi:hypothetical protein
VIRNVVLMKLKDGVSGAQVDAAVAALRRLECEGMLRLTVGRNLGMRPGNWDLAVVSDFEDEASYHAYDQDDEHNRIRRELTGPIAGEVQRAQFALG